MIPSLQRLHPTIVSSKTSPYSQNIHEIHEIQTINVNYPTLLIDRPYMAQGCVFESEGNQIHIIKTKEKYYVSLWNKQEYIEKYCPIDINVLIGELIETSFITPICSIQIMVFCKEQYNIDDIFDIDFDTTTLTTLMFDDFIHIKNLSKKQKKKQHQIITDIIQYNQDMFMDILIDTILDASSLYNSYDTLSSLIQKYPIKDKNKKWHKFMYYLTSIHPAKYELKFSALIKHSFMGQLDEELFHHITNYLRIDEKTIIDLNLNIMTLIEYIFATYHSIINHKIDFKNIIFNTNEHYMCAFDDFYYMMNHIKDSNNRVITEDKIIHTLKQHEKTFLHTSDDKCMICKKQLENRYFKKTLCNHWVCDKCKDKSGRNNNCEICNRDSPSQQIITNSTTDNNGTDETSNSNVYLLLF